MREPVEMVDYRGGTRHTPVSRIQSHRRVKKID
jgi:hypothetical protein